MMQRRRAAHGGRSSTYDAAHLGPRGIGSSRGLGRVAETLLKRGERDEARPLAERALTQRRAAIAQTPDDPRPSCYLPYYEGLHRRAGETP